MSLVMCAHMSVYASICLQLIPHTQCHISMHIYDLQCIARGCSDTHFLRNHSKTTSAVFCFFTSCRLLTPLNQLVGATSNRQLPD